MSILHYFPIILDESGQTGVKGRQKGLSLLMNKHHTPLQNQVGTWSVVA